MLYQFFDAGAAGYPRPAVPALPEGRSSRDPARPRRLSPVFQLLGAGRPAAWRSRARYALHDALKLTGVGPSTTVLMPATHCRTMLDPAIRLGATISLYPMQTDLSPDIDRLRALIRTAEKPVRCMVLTHYFGFAQQTHMYRQLCDEQGIDLIEDCSHAAVVATAGHSIGTQGLYSVASPYKFLPILEGGVLIPRDRDVPMPTQRATRQLRAELRLAKDIYLRPSQASPVGHLPAQQPSGNMPHRVLFSQRNEPGVSKLYEPSEELRAMGLAAQIKMRGLDVDDLGFVRQESFAAWLSLASRLPRCRPLYTHCPADTVPYMFPLLLDDPDRDFPNIKAFGIPAWRWDEIAISDCRVSIEYSQRLIHLPCHYPAGCEQSDWMHRALKSAFQSC